MRNSADYIGPKTPDPRQLPEIIALANRVFRQNKSGDISRDFSWLYDPARTDRMRIFEYRGKPVSLVITVISETTFLGCSLRTASIGSVCTDPAHRGGGLASRLVEDAEQRALAAGAPIMLISGGRGLYVRRGAARCGHFCEYDFPLDSLPRRQESLSVKKVETPEETAAALRLFEGEAIRFRRSVEEYAKQIEPGWVENRPGETWIVRRRQLPVAVFSASRTTRSREDTTAVLKVCEMAGSRPAILAALPELLELFQLGLAVVRAYRSDRTMQDLGAAAGIVARKSEFLGTVKLLDAESLWRGFAPLLCERIGYERYAAIRLSSEKDELKIHRLTFRFNEEELSLDGPQTIMAVLFDSIDESTPPAAMTGELGEMLRQALPLPLPMYGLHYT